IAYAGTAHLVMPLTDDRAVLEPFLAALAPGLMPVQGKNVTAALTLANNMLASEMVPGTVLIVADDLANADAAAVHQAAGRNGVVLLAIASPGQADGSPSGLPIVRVSIDGSDIRGLERRVETHFQAAQAEQAGSRWRDEGFWLLLPGAMLGLLWFRRGTT